MSISPVATIDGHLNDRTQTDINHLKWRVIEHAAKILGVDIDPNADHDAAPPAELESRLKRLGANIRTVSNGEKIWAIEVPVKPDNQNPLKQSHFFVINSKATEESDEIYSVRFRATISQAEPGDNIIAPLPDFVHDILNDMIVRDSKGRHLRPDAFELAKPDKVENFAAAIVNRRHDVPFIIAVLGTTQNDASGDDPRLEMLRRVARQVAGQANMVIIRRRPGAVAFAQTAGSHLAPPDPGITIVAPSGGENDGPIIEKISIRQFPDVRDLEVYLKRVLRPILDATAKHVSLHTIIPRKTLTLGPNAGEIVARAAGAHRRLIVPPPRRQRQEEPLPAAVPRPPAAPKQRKTIAVPVEESTTDQLREGVVLRFQENADAIVSDVIGIRVGELLKSVTIPTTLSSQNLFSFLKELEKLSGKNILSDSGAVAFTDEYIKELDKVGKSKTDQRNVTQIYSVIAWRALEMHLGYKSYDEEALALNAWLQDGVPIAIKPSYTAKQARRMEPRLTGHVNAKPVIGVDHILHNDKLNSRQYIKTEPGRTIFVKGPKHVNYSNK